MTLRRIMVAGLLIVIAAVAFALQDYLSVDRCLDRGGRWETGACVFREG